MLLAVPKNKCFNFQLIGCSWKLFTGGTGPEIKRYIIFLTKPEIKWLVESLKDFVKNDCSIMKGVKIPASFMEYRSTCSNFSLDVWP